MNLLAFGRITLSGLIILFAVACTSPKNQETTSEIAGPPVGIPEQGKPLYAVCSACHGANGEGNKSLQAPALANLDGWYLYRQLINYQNGIRGNPVDDLGQQMVSVAKGFGDSVKIAHVVAYIGTMSPVQLPGSTAGDARKGERIYQSICGSCHGTGGKGNELMNAPRLNGLEEWYLKRQVNNFKDSIRGNHPDDPFGAQMIPMANLLKSDEALDDVVAYILSNSQAPIE